MKLIIDIDEKIYRAVIEDNDMEIVGDNTIELGRAIANGTPISTEGDLISRSNLKKAFNKWWGCDDIPTNVAEDTIDTAPAIEIPNYGGQVVPDTLQGWRYEERPQGEWNYIQADMCVCPFCGAMPHKLYKNYCAKCGAELKGGAA